MVVVSARTFPLGDVLTVTTGVLLAERGIAAVYELLDYMTGNSLMTHQLPRAGRECAPWLVAQHPWLADIPEPKGLDSLEDCRAWLEPLADRYGAEVVVQPVPEGAHERRDPIAELREMAPDKPIVVVREVGEDR